MITLVRLLGLQAAAGQMLLAAAILLAPATPVLAQGAAAGVTAAVSAVPRTSAGPISVPPAATGVMGAGTESRMWADPPLPLKPPPATPPFKVTTTEHLKIPMRDGIKLDALLYTPERKKPAGCILVADGYGWSFDPRDRRFAEQQGYAVLNVSMRGIFQSEGDAALYDSFHDDGYELVEWMAKQSWCADGHVGIFGSSLPGIAPWQIANALPPHLKAIAPDVACADCYNFLWYPGGTLPGPGREDRGDHEYLAAIQHRDRDAWWDKQIVDDNELAAIARSEMGVMVSGGLQDFITPGNVNAFMKLHDAGGQTRLLMEFGDHFGARTGVIGPWHHETHMDLFFAHYLRGEKNAWSDGKTYKGDALIWIMGPNKFRWEKTWPIPDTNYTKLYLRAKSSGTIKLPTPRGRAASDDPEAGKVNLTDGSLSLAAPAADEAPMIYKYFPESGPFLATGRLQGGGWTKVDESEYENKTVSWTTDALTFPTEVTGNIVFDFSASSNSPDADVVLLVTDLGPDGKSHYVTSGVLNMPRYPDASKPNLMKPGEIRKFKISTQPIAYVFQPGHRVRFSVAGGATPAPDQPRAAQAPGKNSSYALVTIFQDAAHPATITMPIIGTGRLTSEVASAQ